MADPKASLIITLKDFASKGLATISGKLDKLKRDIDNARGTFLAISATIGLVGGAALKASAQFEQWRVSFTTMLGGADKADEMLRRIKKFAAETPFDLPQVITGSKRLLAFGIAAGDVIPTMKALGDVAAGLSVPIGQLVNAFGQVRAAGRLMGQEVLQFTNAGVPILELLAKRFDTTAGAVKKLVEQGKVGFEDVRAVLFEASQEGGKFADLMLKQAKTFEGAMSLIRDQMFQTFVSLGDNFLPIAKKVAFSLVDTLGKVRKWVEENRALTLTITLLAGATATLLTSLTALAFILPNLIAGFTAIATIATFLASPWLILGGVIAAFATNFLNFKDTILRSIRDLGDAFSSFAKGVGALFRGDITLAIETFKGAASVALDGLTRIGRDTASSVAESWQKLKDSIETNPITGKVNLPGGGAPGSSQSEDIEAQKAEEAAAKRRELLQREADNEIETMRFTEEARENFRLNRMEAELAAAGEMERLRDLQAAREQARLRKRHQAEIQLNKDKVKSTRDTFSNLAAIGKTKSKEINAVVKAAAIARTTIDTYVAGTKALKEVPFPFNIALSASIIALGLANVARISSTPLAAGGVVLPTQGGTLAQIGEAGSAEAVIPLEDSDSLDRIREALGGGGSNITIEAGVIVADDMSVREFARRIDEELFQLKANRESAFEG